MSPSNSLALLATLLIATSFTINTNAQSSSGCTTALVGLSPCLNYISGNDTTPSGSCCSQLGSVVQSKPECLCLVLNSGSSNSLGVTINQTRALELPGACNVQTPSASKCNTNSTSTTPSSSTPSTGNSGSKDVPNSVVDSAATYEKTSSIVFLALVVVSVAMIR